MSGPHRSVRILLAALAAVTALLTVFAFAWRVRLIPLPVSFNPNEGWNAFQALRAIGVGGPLYPPAAALTSNNYPPLSFLVVGWAARGTGIDAVVAGRVVSLMSLLATAGGVAWAVRRLRPRDAWAPAAAAGLVLGFAATQFRAYLAMDDPQWLAHAIMTPALALLIPATPNAAPDKARTAAAAVLVVLGGLVKHNLLALPLAATAWLAWRHRAALGVWLAVGIAGAGLALTATVAAYGSAGVSDVLVVARQGSWTRMVRSAAGPLAASVPLMAAAGLLWSSRRSDRRVELPLLFAAVAVPFGVYQRSGAGVNFNAHFEALVALSVCAALTLASAREARDPQRKSLLAALCLLPLLVLAPLAAAATLKEVRALPAERRAWTEMERAVAAAPGPVACETPTLCFRAGRPFLLDFFLEGQRLAAGGDREPLRRALAERRIVWVERDADRPLKPGDAPNPLLRELDARSRTTFTAEDGRRLRAVAP